MPRRRATSSTVRSDLIPTIAASGILLGGEVIAAADAQAARDGAIAAIGAAISAMLAEVDGLTPKARLAARRKKVLDMGRKGLA